MSEFGDIIDRLEVHWRTADTKIPLGTTGFERDVRLASDLTSGQFPHVFAHDPAEASTRLPLRESTQTVSIQFDYWTRQRTQEQVAVVLDAFGVAVQADPTLNGKVEDAWISSRAVIDHQFAGKPERAGVVIVTTQKVLA